LSSNISNLKEAASTIKKKTDSVLAKKQPQADSETLKKEVLALRKEVNSCTVHIHCIYIYYRGAYQDPLAMIYVCINYHRPRD